MPERKSRQSNLINRLEGFCYYPAQLSGGMLQHASIARAFASLRYFMDEPLKGLDAVLKQNLIKWFLPIWKADN